MKNLFLLPPEVTIPPMMVEIISAQQDIFSFKSHCGFMRRYQSKKDREDDADERMIKYLEEKLDKLFDYFDETKTQ